MTALLAPRPRKAIGQNAALQVLPQLPLGVRRDAPIFPVVVAQGKEGAMVRVACWTCLDYYTHLSREAVDLRTLMSTTAMTVQDVAEYLNVDPKTVYRMVKRGDLPGFKVGGSWRFQKEDLDAWIAKQKEAAANHLGEDER